MWGRKGMSRLVGKSASKLAKNISKEDFLRQLKDAWRSYVKKSTPIEDELAAAMERIQSSPFKNAFDTAGVTEEDICALLEEIRKEKVDTMRYEQAKVGRNEPCPCGSGKKYKKCCGR